MVSYEEAMIEARGLQREWMTQARARIEVLEKLPRAMLSAAQFIDGCLKQIQPESLGRHITSMVLGSSIQNDEYNQLTNARTHLGGCLRKLREIVKD